MESGSQMYRDFKACERVRMARDARFDGRFFIGVTSTGIYCRVICPAPHAKSSNVKYYPTAAAAAEAGFRPCLRCRPEAAPGTPAWLGTSTTVRRGLKLINEGALDIQSVEELAARLGIGSRHLHRLFIQHVGASPMAVAQTRRLHFAKRLIDDTNLPMTDIALASGFGSLRRFNDAFHQTYGKAPRELRRERRRDVPDGDTLSLKLAYRPPYHWEAIRDFLATRALPGVEEVTEQGYARTIEVGDSHGWFEVRPVPDADALELMLHDLGPAALFTVVRKVRQIFDLGADPEDVRSTLKEDELLAPLLRASPGLRVPGAWCPFELSVRAVLGQQVSVAAARTFAARIVAAHGERLSTSRPGLTHLFPAPKALATADLDAIGITGARARTLNALSEAVAEGALSFEATAEEAREHLQRIPGIGAWTAEYAAMRGLADPDAFPAEDLVLRRVAGQGESLSARELKSRAEAWRPWRSYAVLHLWRAASVQS